MSDVTKLPSAASITDPAAKEILGVLLGDRGNPLDRAVTLRDLQNAGIANISFNPNANGKGRVTIVPSATDAPDLTIPPAITDFTVDGAYRQILLGWSKPNMRNLGYVEVWRWATDNIAAALVNNAGLIGQSSGNGYADVCGSGKTYYYWVRAVSDTAVVGPFNSGAGTIGKTAVDVEYMLEQLNGQITESQLWKGLGARIDLVDAGPAIAGSVNSRLKLIYDEVFGPDKTGSFVYFKNNDFKSVKNQSEASAELLNVLATGSTDGAGQSVTAMYEDIKRVHTALSRDPTDGVISLVEQVDTLAAVVDFGKDANGNPISASAYIQTKENALVENSINPALGLKASASTVTNIITSVGLKTDGSLVDPTKPSFTAQVTALNQSITDPASGGIAKSVQDVSARMNNLKNPDGSPSTVTLEQAMVAQVDVNGNLKGQYTVKLDVNGYVSGFGLASGPVVPGEGASKFYIRADRFVVGAPGSNATPFTVVTGGTNPGTYMDAAYIKDATITSAKVANLNADRLTAGMIQGRDIEGTGKIFGPEIYVGGTATYTYYTDSDGVSKKSGISGITNPNLSVTSTGILANATFFKISNPGYANQQVFTVSNGVVRLGTTKIATTISSEDGTSWSINNTGYAEFNNVKVRGDVLASSVTAGAIDGQTITGNTISGATISGATVNAGNLHATNIYTGSKFIDSDSGQQIFSNAASSQVWGGTGWLDSRGWAQYVLTSDLLKFYGPSYHSGAPINQRVRAPSSAVPLTFVISASAEVEHWMSAFYRINGGAWTWLATTIDQGSGAGSGSFTTTLTLSSSFNYIEFGAGPVDLAFSIYVGHYEIRNFCVSVTAVNV